MLSRSELAKFSSIIMENNQQDNLRIGDSGALIPTDDAKTYKLVSYYMDSEGNPVLNNVYKLENYDYNIHSGQPNIAELIIQLEEDGASDGLRRIVLQPYVNTSKTILRRYNQKSGKYVSVLKSKGTGRVNTEDSRINKSIGETVSQGDRKAEGYGFEELTQYFCYDDETGSNQKYEHGMQIY